MNSAPSPVVLYSFWRSSCAYRVRIALALKKIAYEYRSVNLQRGDQRSAAYLAVNPMGQVPSLRIDDTLINDSIAIMEYLEDSRSTGQRLLPQKNADRASIRSMCQMIAAGIQPLQSGRTTRDLSEEVHVRVARQFIEEGFKGAPAFISNFLAALESRMEIVSGRCTFGDTVTMADCCLLPQVVNAQRYMVDMMPYPTIQRVSNDLLEIAAFKTTAPELQPDAHDK